jgi:signal transduction histidine kinase
LKEFVRATPDILQARAIDRKGPELVRIDREKDGIVEATDLQDKVDRYYVMRGLKLPNDAVYVSRLDLNIEHGRVQQPPLPVVRFVARVPGDEPTPAGLVVLNRDARPLLRKVERWSQGTVGKLFLVDDEGTYLWHEDPAEQFGAQGMLASGANLQKDMPEVAEWALSGTATVAVWRNRGLVAARAPIPWLDGSAQIIAVATEDQAVATSAAEFFPLLAWLAGATIAGAAAVLLVWRSQRSNLERMRALAHARGSALVEASAALAHEVRNPLAAIVNSVGLLRAADAKARPDTDDIRLMEIVISESARLERTLADFLEMARSEKRPPALVDVAALAEDVVELARRDPIFSSDVALSIDAAGKELPAPILANADQIRQVLWNLLLNAGAASKRAGGSSVRVRIETGRIGDAPGARVEIEDDGPGPPDLTSDRRAPPKGGLGLIVALGIVARHGGQLELRARSDGQRGTSAVLVLPAKGVETVI